MIELRKSYRLSRFHFAIVLILLAVMGGIFLRFFTIIQSSIEQVSVDLNVLNFQQMLRYQAMLVDKKGSNCQWLNNSEIFKGLGIEGMNGLGEMYPVSGAWVYDSKNHTLSYSVHSTTFFKSDVERKIVVSLYCSKGAVNFKLNDFHWCKDKRIWGCQAW